MNVVSNSEASRIAGVSRQAIQDLKRINADNKRKYPFFVFDPETGKPGVNIDHREWQNYLNRNRGKRVKKKQQINTSKSKERVNENEETVKKKKFADAVISATKIKFNPKGADLKEFVNIIEREYDKII